MWARCTAWYKTPRGRRVLAVKIIITVLVGAYWVHPATAAIGSVIWLWSKLDA